MDLPADAGSHVDRCRPAGAEEGVGCRKSIRTQRRSSETGYDQPPSMLLFVLYACLRLLIDLALAPLRDRAADQAELLVLRHQVRVLERHVKVVRWRQADRLVLAALARRLPRPCWSTLLVKPETVLRWHRELVRRKWATFAGRPRRGRPSIAQECHELIRQLANENAGWGYLRLKGELRKLGFEVSGSTIRRVLREHRIPPAPRRSALTWRGFLAAHAATIVATDFFSVDTVFLKRLYILFFIHLESRRILFAACTESPDSGWVTQQARNLSWELPELGLRPRFLIRDRDAKFAATFDSVLAAKGTEVRRTPPRSPRANSIAERSVASARREALDWLLVVNERHLRSILKEYVEHYNRARPHRSLDLRPPTGDPPLGDPDAPVIVTTRLGGLLREYSRAAARRQDGCRAARSHRVYSPPSSSRRQRCFRVEAGQSRFAARAPSSAPVDPEQQRDAEPILSMPHRFASPPSTGTTHSRTHFRTPHPSKESSSDQT
jgi:putative transposase